MSQATSSTTVPTSEDAAKKPAQAQASTPPKSDSSTVQSGPGKETDTSMELLANMLLQISKGKDTNTPSSTATSAGTQTYPTSSYQLAQGYNSQIPLAKMDEKRQRINDVNYDMSSQVHPNYPMMYSQYPSFVPPKSTYPYSAPPSRYNYVQQSSNTPPPIPPPAPVHKTPKPSPSIGDYYVFCTVCRHGTPINVTKPIPEVFKCSNCGFSCALDTHLLSYYV